MKVEDPVICVPENACAMATNQTNQLNAHDNV